MVLAVIAITLVTSIGIAFLGLSLGTSERMEADVDAQRAFYVAEAGLAEAFQGVRVGRTGALASERAPARVDQGLVWVTSTETAENQIRLDSHARVGRGSTSLSLTVEPVREALGFFSREDMIIEDVVLVDGFNSDDRPYLEEALIHHELDSPPVPVDPQTLDVSDWIGEFLSKYSEHFLNALLQPGFYSINSLDGGMTYDYEYLSDKLVEYPGSTSREGENRVARIGTGTMSGEDFDQLTEMLPLARELFPNGWYDGNPDESDNLIGFTENNRLNLGTARSEPDTLTLDELHTGSGGLLSSNADIIFESASGDNSTIWGEVTPGPDGEIVGSNNLEISGSTDPRPMEVELPEVEVPVVVMEDGIDHAGLMPLTLPPGQTGYDFLSVDAGAELVLTGPATIVVGDLQLVDGATLTLDTSMGAVELFVTSGMHLAEGSILETTNQTPEDLSIQVASLPREATANVQLRSTAQFHGVVYAPDADVRIGSDFEIFGSVVARRLEISPRSKLHFDNAEFEGSPIPDVVSWRFLQLPGSDPSRSKDPFLALGLNPDLLPSLDQAHDLDNVLLMLDYLDLSGNEHTYVGSESDFDWSQVEDVLAIDRQPTRVQERADTEGPGSEPATASAAEETQEDDPFSFQDWWEEPSILDPRIRRGVSVIRFTYTMGSDRQNLRAILDLSPLSAIELNTLSAAISSLPANAVDQIMDAQ